MAGPEHFQMPPDMRTFAEKSIDQAKQAFDGFISAAQQAVSAFEGQAESARKGARTVAEKAMSFAEQNVAKSFELAQQLVRAKVHQGGAGKVGAHHQGLGGADRVSADRAFRENRRVGALS